MRFRETMLTAFSAVILVLAGCNTTPAPEATTPADQADVERTARAELRNAEGAVIGTATFTQDDDDDEVEIKLEARGLTPGEHGFHIHENGVCEAPDFASAGGHFNPTNKAHGTEAEGGPHVGDLRNLEVGDDGEGETEREIDGATLAMGQNSIVGKALVIHANPDDYKSQPSGDAGGRVACGVITQ